MSHQSAVCSLKGNYLGLTNDVTNSVAVTKAGLEGPSSLSVVQVQWTDR